MVKIDNGRLVIECETSTDPVNDYYSSLHAIIDKLEGTDNYSLCNLLREMLPTYQQFKSMMEAG